MHAIVKVISNARALSFIVLLLNQLKQPIKDDIFGDRVSLLESLEVASFLDPQRALLKSPVKYRSFKPLAALPTSLHNLSRPSLNLALIKTAAELLKKIVHLPYRFIYFTK